MRSTRPAFLMAALAVGFLGIYWAAGHAQERPALFAPPPVLPIEPPEPAPAPKAPAKNSKPAKPADPTLIIPAAVYEEPRPIKAKGETSTGIGNELELPPKIVQTGVQLPLPIPMESGVPSPAPPAPLFPALPGPLDKKAVETPLPLPAPVVLPEPTKALIPEPTRKEVPKALELPKVAPLLAPPPAGLEAPPRAAPAEPLVAPAVLPSIDKPRAFVRIRPEPMAPSTVTPIMPAPLTEVRTIEPIAKQAPSPVGEPAVIASSVQTPSITLEKRGPIAPRLGETVSYQITIRNQGGLPAQQIRIEDELAQDARFITAEPMPILNGSKVIWTLGALAANQEQVLRLTLQAGAPGAHHMSVHVMASNQGAIVNVQRPANVTSALGVELIAPRQLAIGKPAVFEIRVVNHAEQPLTGLVLHGVLPAGLNTQQGRTIEGEVGGTLQPGETKTLRMPTDVVQAGHFTVEAKVTTRTGQEASASAAIDIGADSLQIQQAASSRLFVGRDGDLRFEVVNSTSRALRNLAVSNRLPDGLEYVMASERGLYQANSRTVHWLIDNLPAGATQTLHLRVIAAKPGNFQNGIVARADGGVQAQSSGTIVVQAVAELSLHVIDKDRVIEVGRETSYEIQLENPGHAAASNVRIQVQFPPGMIPKNVQANTPYTQDRQAVVFEAIASLPPQAKEVYRIIALAQTTGDQRVRFSVVSDQVPTPIVREISTLAYRD